MEPSKYSESPHSDATNAAGHNTDSKILSKLSLPKELGSVRRISAAADGVAMVLDIAGHQGVELANGLRAVSHIKLLENSLQVVFNGEGADIKN